MRSSVAIIKKELRSYFFSPIAYVIIGLFLFFMGVIFTKFVEIYQRYNAARQFGQGQGITIDKLATYLYQNMAFLLCFLTPLITMRLFAEEKRQNTFELLFTAPIRGAGLVLGKFIAAYLLMGLMVGLSFVYVLFMILWGNPDVAIISSTYFGILLALACYVSLGGLISSMTSSQAIAAVWTFVVLLLLWLLQSIAQGITVRWETFFGVVELGPTLEYLSPLKHFNDSLAQGLIYLKDIVYFLSFTGLVLFLTHRVVESNRWR